MTEQTENVLLLGLCLCVCISVTIAIPTRITGRTGRVSQLSDILSGLQTLQNRGEFSEQMNSDVYQQKRDKSRRQPRENYDLLIELKEPVKIQAVPEIKNDNSIEDHDVMSGMDKRQGAWDADYGLGGGRFGKRGYADYTLGGGRFGRDVDHVDPVHFEEESA